MPAASCTFMLREIHWDGIRACQHILNEKAEARHYFPGQMNTFIQEKAVEIVKKVDFKLKIRASQAGQRRSKNCGIPRKNVYKVQL